MRDKGRKHRKEAMHMLTKKKQRMLGKGKERGGGNEWMAIHKELYCNA